MAWHFFGKKISSAVFQCRFLHIWSSVTKVANGWFYQKCMRPFMQGKTQISFTNMRWGCEKFFLQRWEGVKRLLQTWGRCATISFANGGCKNFFLTKRRSWFKWFWKVFSIEVLGSICRVNINKHVDIYKTYLSLAQGKKSEVLSKNWIQLSSNGQWG